MMIKSISSILILLILITVCIGGCHVTKLTTRSIPSVKEFELNRYLGTWYEIARIPNPFEKDWHQVTASYSLREDGKIEVINRGYNQQKDKWEQVRGKAWIPDKSKPAELKVSFIWSLAADYKIIYLEDDYSLAIVTSNSLDYLWILSRTPEISENYYQELVQKAAQLGFDSSRLIRVKQM